MSAQRDVYPDLETEYNARIKKLEEDLARLTNRFWLQRGAAGDQRMLYGLIYNDGNIFNEGSGGWSSEIVGSVMVITFDEPFSDLPEVIVQAALDAEWDGDTSPYDPTAYSFGRVTNSSDLQVGDKRGNTVAGMFTSAEGTYNYLTFGYRMSGASNTFDVAGRIYEDSGGSPGAAVTDIITGTFNGTSVSMNTNGTLIFPTPQTLPAGDYWIAIAIISGDNYVELCYIGGGTGIELTSDTTLDDPFPGGGSSNVDVWDFLAHGSVDAPGLQPTVDAVSGFSRTLVATDKVGVLWWDLDGNNIIGYLPFSFSAVGV